MIVLNLIPKEKKAELGLTQLFITIKNVIILILVITILVAISLLGTKLALQNYFTKVVEETTLTTQYATSFGRGVKTFNQKLGNIEKIQAEYVAWTDFLIKFAALIPEDTTIYSLDVDKNLLITGMAKTRDDLLLLRDNFENSDMLTNVEVPLDNLLKKEDVDFILKADIDVNKF